ncbi:DUF938 domain-containing protein [Maricaulis sp.]|uniref:DUF938 domain-containing protein n=1 Tax=Maricaulis sp. TaxID=1486257 RepID=UPI001B219D15|nr:DUF938 domain-containing protein [Maricaulis sp.]MBO6797126.1 DUF938 domain-containing protein [Maricaulis sp.]
MDTSDTPTALEKRAQIGDRLSSPSAERNKGVIAKLLAETLPSGARVLEIGSGTGQHALEAVSCRSDLLWQPSDPDVISRASQDAWALDAPDQIMPSKDLNLLQPDWAAGLGPFDALVCMNVIHISPWGVCQQIAAQARRLLSGHGVVFLYGPYKEGEATAPSNLDFDRSLQSRNPEWGVRDLDVVLAEMASGGLTLERRVNMPANNLSLIFKFAGAEHASS